MTKVLAKTLPPGPRP